MGDQINQPFFLLLLGRLLYLDQTLGPSALNVCKFVYCKGGFSRIGDDRFSRPLAMHDGREKPSSGDLLEIQSRV